MPTGRQRAGSGFASLMARIVTVHDISILDRAWKAVSLPAFCDKAQAVSQRWSLSVPWVLSIAPHL